MDFSDPEFNAIVEKMTLLVGQALPEIMETEEYSDELEKLNALMLKKFGHIITDVIVKVTYKVAEVKETEGESGRTASQQPGVNVSFDIGAGDMSFLKGLKVSAEPDELEEIERDLQRARERKLLPPASTESEKPKLETGEIINNIRMITRQLDPDARLRVAQGVNGDEESKYWDVKFPENENLINERIWLNCIQEVVNKIVDHSGNKEKMEKALRGFMQFLILAGLNE
ncbi:MAG: hypothetical protein WD898_03915 [Candidatus Paceibacterota bacterium]